MGNFRCITDRIFSRSSVETPMLSSACRMPQSGQMGVWLSVLESAGTPEYGFPQSGQTAETGLSVFMVVHLPLADVHGFPQVFQVKAELAVSVHTGADVGRSGTQRRSAFFRCLQGEVPVPFCSRNGDTPHSGQERVHLVPTPTTLPPERYSPAWVRWSDRNRSCCL